LREISLQLLLDLLINFDKKASSNRKSRKTVINLSILVENAKTRPKKNREIMTDFQNLQLLLDLLINYRFQSINFDKFIENFTLFL